MLRKVSVSHRSGGDARVPPLQRLSERNGAAHSRGMAAWASQRRDTVAAVGGSNVSLPAVVAAMVGNETVWEGAVSFCEDVMLTEEAAEWDREIDSPFSSHSRRLPIFVLHESWPAGGRHGAVSRPTRHRPEMAAA